jgi:hypothetical protein
MTTLAKLQIVIDRIPESFLDLFDITSLEGDDISCVDDLSVEDFSIGVEIHLSGVSFIPQHGFTPASVKNRFIDLKAPLSVSFLGCGRWNTARTPPRAILTLEPLPSLISAPRAARSLMMSSQGTSALTGVLKMAVRVFWCFLERVIMILFYDITRKKSRKKSIHLEKYIIW